MCGHGRYGNIDWGYTVEPQTTPLAGDIPSGFDGRSYPIPRGKTLGGSNELNYMLHVRGTPGDYKGWEAATGDPRWGPASMASAEMEYEEKIAFGAWEKQDRLNITEDWLEAGGQTKHGNSADYNKGKRDGAFVYQHAVRKGTRQSTARQFLLPRLKAGVAPNLDVVIGAHVEKILLEKMGPDGDATRAAGVAFELGPSPGFLGISIPTFGRLLPALSARGLFGALRSPGRRTVRCCVFGARVCVRMWLHVCSPRHPHTTRVRTCCCCALHDGDTHTTPARTCVVLEHISFSCMFFFAGRLFLAHTGIKLQVSGAESASTNSCAYETFVVLLPMCVQARGALHVL